MYSKYITGFNLNGDSEPIQISVSTEEPIKCKFCDVLIMINPPFYIEISKINEWVLDIIDVMLICKNCRHTFIGRAKYVNPNKYKIFKFPLPTPKANKFSEKINNLFSNFVEIYNQAFSAEEYNLNLICGAGYRKALEFLIKDFLIHTKVKSKEEIKTMQLGACIKLIKYDMLKNIAEKATWIGNDETPL